MSETLLTVFNQSSNQKPTIVFLSGLFAGGWIWEKTIENSYFKDNRLAILEKPLVDYTNGKQNLDTIVSNVTNALIDQKLHDNVCFVGNSLGSLIGLLIAQNKSINTSKIVLSGCPCRNSNIDLGIGTVVTPNVTFAQTMRSKLFYDPTVIEDDVLTKILETTYTRLNFVKVLKILKELDTFSIDPYLQNTALPIKLIWGENDNVTPLSYWKNSLDLNPLISLDTIENCGHSPMLEKSEHFSKILHQYINN